MNFLDAITWRDLLIYSPLGVVGAWRWGVWAWQRFVSLFYKPVPVRPGFVAPKFSVITPVYNEDPDLFLNALSSWRQNKAAEIIAVIDAKDERCIEVFRRFATDWRETETHLIITSIPGKRAALAQGIRASQYEIVALVDSDTVWDENISDKLLAPFESPYIGGVAPRQAVMNPRTVAERLFAIRLDLRYLFEFPYLMVIGNSLTCLSGRTAVYRRKAIYPFLDALVNETFLGKQCISGEDKRLTSLIMKAGWRVRYQQHACVRTPGMPILKNYLLQNLRWARNSWRTDLRMLGSGWIWAREPFFAYHLIDRAIQPFTLLLGPIYFGIAIAFQHYAIAILLGIWWFVSRAVRIFPHLREAPQDFFMVPMYLVSSYILAVLKIYALSTLDHQTWITRWDKSRMQHWGFLKLLPSRAATFCVIGGIAYMVFQHEYQIVQEARSKAAEPQIAVASFPYTEDFSQLPIEEQEADFWKKREENTTASYRVRRTETPLSIGHMLNISQADLQKIFPRRSLYSLLPQGTIVKIPASALQQPNSVNKQPISRKLTILYEPATDTIRIKGRGSVITVPQLARYVPKSRLEQVGEKEWMLRSNIRVGDGVTLIVKGEDVRWLKLLSIPEKTVTIQSFHGSILFHDTKVSSWDEKSGTYDTNTNDERAYVIAKTNGRMDVINSEVSYLGYGRDVEIRKELQYRKGGIYGLSWKIPNATYGSNVITGVVRNSRIHGNYFGLYSYGASGLIVSDNEIYDNIQYGIDPHDDSNNLLIENNYVHDNGNHGIIGSKRVVYSTIRNNYSTRNRLHGIMLDRQSNYNLVENNISSDNVNGLAIFDSHNNLIRDNKFLNDRFGIRANAQSSDNRFESNTIQSNEKGVYLYGGASDNILIGNSIEGNRQGVALKDGAAGNIVMSSLRPFGNIVNIKSEEQAKTANYFERIE